MPKRKWIEATYKKEKQNMEIRKITTAEKQKMIKEDYPRNIMLIVQSEIFDREIELPIEDVTEDIHNGLIYAISQMSERDQAILRMRFEEHRTQTEIAEILGVSKSRIGSLEYKAVRLLCKPPLLGYLKYGKECYEKRIKDFEAEKMAKGFSAETLNTPISEFDFSIHVENALTRAGYVTLGDIVHLTEEQLMSIKNIGRKEGQEIAYKLRGIGTLHTKWEVFFQDGVYTERDKEKKRPKIDRTKVKALIERSLQNMIDNPENGMTEEQVQEEFGSLTSEEGLDILMSLLYAVAEGKAKPEPKK